MFLLFHSWQCHPKCSHIFLSNAADAVAVTNCNTTWIIILRTLAKWSALQPIRQLLSHHITVKKKLLVRWDFKKSYWKMNRGHVIIAMFDILYTLMKWLWTNKRWTEILLIAINCIFALFSYCYSKSCVLFFYMIQSKKWNHFKYIVFGT